MPDRLSLEFLIIYLKNTDPRLSKAMFVDFRDTRKFDRCPVQGSVILSRNIDLALKESKKEHRSNVPLLCLGMLSSLLDTSLLPTILLYLMIYQPRRYYFPHRNR